MVTEVLEYLGEASAAGVIGNGVYVAVDHLAGWMREQLGWDGREVLELPDDTQRHQLAVLFESARREWAVPGPTTAIQNITVGRDMNAPAINRAGTDR